MLLLAINTTICKLLVLHTKLLLLLLMGVAIGIRREVRSIVGVAWIRHLHVIAIESHAHVGVR